MWDWTHLSLSFCKPVDEKRRDLEGEEIGRPLPWKASSAWKQRTFRLAVLCDPTWHCQTKSQTNKDKTGRGTCCCPQVLQSCESTSSHLGLTPPTLLSPTVFLVLQRQESGQWTEALAGNLMGPLRERMLEKAADKLGLKQGLMPFSLKFLTRSCKSPALTYSSVLLALLWMQ